MPFYMFFHLGHLFFVQVPQFSAAPDEGEEDMTTLSAIVMGPNMKIYVTGAGRYSLYHSRPQAAFTEELSLNNSHMSGQFLRVFVTYI